MATTMKAMGDNRMEADRKTTRADVKQVRVTVAPPAASWDLDALTMEQLNDPDIGSISRIGVPRTRATGPNGNRSL